MSDQLLTMPDQLLTMPKVPRRVRRGPSDKLREALEELAGGHAQITGHAERAWASITFSGARHSVDLLFEGNEAADAGEMFIALLPDHEFTIPGQLVAEATISSVTHRLAHEETLAVTAELLLLCDS